MSSWAKSTARWFKRLVGGEEQPAQSLPSQTVVCTGAQAVIATEVLASERVCRAASSVETRSREAREAGPNAFGERVFESVTDDAKSALALAAGRALGGTRTAVLLPEGRLLESHAMLHTLVARRAPLVAHAVVCSDTGSAATLGTDGHGPYHALADTGVVLGMAKNAQRAVDMSLVARRVAEIALTPAVVAQEGPEVAWAPASVALPDAKLVAQMLGEPHEVMSSPTSAQTLLLGKRRARVPRWFNPDRPAAHGMQLSGRDLAVGLAGSRAFFADPVEAALREAIEELAEHSGRKLELVSRHKLGDAEYAFVAMGSAIELAEAVADYLRKERKTKIGVLGIEWLRPLAQAEIAEALSGVRVATVLERTADAFTGAGPLLAEIRAAIGDQETRLLAASYGLGGQPLGHADLLGVFENMKLDSAARDSLLIGVEAPGKSTGHPRRDVLDQKLASEYPELGRSLMAIEFSLDLRPKSARTIALWARRAESPEEVLDRAAAKAAEVIGKYVTSRVGSAEQGAWVAEVTVSDEPLRGPAGHVRHDVTIVAAPELPFDINPLKDLVKEGFALVSSPLPPEAFWKDLPESWRAAIRERDLSVYVLGAPVSELVEHLSWLLGRGEELETASGRPARVDWTKLSDPKERELDKSPPLAVRRFSKSRSTYDNLPRFWGELALPRIEQGEVRPVADPYLSLGAVPPSTSGLFQVAVHKNRMPRIDASRCTGCGDCWSACPDSAIAPAFIRTEALLDRAAELGSEPGAERNPIADKLKRAHKQLAARIDGTLAKQSAKVLGEEVLTESFGWLVEQMKIAEDDRPAFAKAFAATVKPILKLSVAVTEPFFHLEHAREKGKGELLCLETNPAACQGCGACSAVCAEEAITIGGRSEKAVSAASAGWQIWEQLPDPSGESIEHAALAGIGKLAAILSSRHTLLAVTGGGGHEPGSGSRLGARLVAAVGEYHAQRQLGGQARKLDKLGNDLHDAVRKSLAAAIPSEDLAQLDRALEAVPDRTGNTGALVSALEGLGERATLDKERARRLVESAKEVRALRELLVSGRDGMGRARYGLVVTGASLATWAAEFPRNPFAVPVVVELGPAALDVAIGLAESLLERHLAEARRVRLAELVLAGPSDLVLAEKKLAALVVDDLTAEERASCPPLVVLAGPEVLSAEALPGLQRALGSGLPIKVIVLDGRERLLGAGTSILPFVVDRRAFVLSSTFAHREHLFAGTEAAFGFAGPALVHLYAPSPARHGFDTAVAVERARAAVESRVHPLLRFDPREAGVFGQRLSLEGNPDLARPWAMSDEGEPFTPAHFALGEARFAGHFVAADGSTQPVADWALGSAEQRKSARPALAVGDEQRVLDTELARAVVQSLESWRTLQELAGVVTPFTAAVRAGAEAEVATAHAAELSALRAEYEQKLVDLRVSQLEDATSRLGSRLLELAGYARAKNGGRTV